MQLDFHYATTYVLARWADFSHEDAETIAHACQFTDDANSRGFVKFSNGVMCSQIPTSHKASDYDNFKDLSQYQVWIPFHFLPGNAGMKPGEETPGTFIAKLVTEPDSYVCKDMILAALRTFGSAVGLYRLGIAIHVLSDSWSHRGFAGIKHAINDITLFGDLGEEEGFIERLKDLISDWFGNLLSMFMSQSFPLGHAAALDYPDLPYLSWRYSDDDSEYYEARSYDLERTNYIDFVDAADCVYRVLCSAGENGGRYWNLAGLSLDQRNLLKSLFEEIKIRDPELRTNIWLAKIKDGTFGFDGELREYDRSRWKREALGEFGGKSRPNFRPEFLQSNWKLFYDAVFSHRYDVTRVILPKYDICVA